MTQGNRYKPLCEACSHPIDPDPESGLSHICELCGDCGYCSGCAADPAAHDCPGLAKLAAKIAKAPYTICNGCGVRNRTGMVHRPNCPVLGARHGNNVPGAM